MGETAPEIDELVTAVLTASRVLVGVAAESLATLDESVTVAQFRTLVVLSTRRGTNLHGLAAELDVNASTAMRMVDKLIAAGLVTRDENPGNRREVVLDVTAQGRRLVTTVTRRRRTAIARIVTAIPPASRDALVGALQAFAVAAGEPQLEPSGSLPGW